MIKKSINMHLSQKGYESEFIYGNGTAGRNIADVLSTIDLIFHKKITY